MVDALSLAPLQNQAKPGWSNYAKKAENCYTVRPFLRQIPPYYSKLETDPAMYRIN